MWPDRPCETKFWYSYTNDLLVKFVRFATVNICTDDAKELTNLKRIHVCVCVSVCLHMCVRTHVYTCVAVCVHICMCVCVHVCACCVCVCTCMCVCVLVCVCGHAYIMLYCTISNNLIMLFS